MKINKFIPRILSSLGMIIFLALIWIFLPIPGIPILVSALTAGLLWEYYRLIFFEKSNTTFINSSLFFICLSFIAYLLCLSSNYILDFVLIFTLFLVFSFWFLYWKKEDILQKLSLGIISLFYIAWPTALFLQVFLQENTGSELLLLCLCIIFSGDVFAWVGGQFISGKKWVLAISPGKTWAGLFCGLFASGLTFVLGFYLIQPHSFEFSYSHQAMIYFICFLLGTLSFFVAQTGDLFVSLLKRKAGVKDSSCLLPGHGGLLDRLDGFLLAFPFLYFFIKILSQFYF